MKYYVCPFCLLVCVSILRKKCGNDSAGPALCSIVPSIFPKLSVAHNLNMEQYGGRLVAGGCNLELETKVCKFHSHEEGPN